jgi:hypothetical protein
VGEKKISANLTNFFVVIFFLGKISQISISKRKRKKNLASKTNMKYGRFIERRIKIIK